MEPSLLGLNAVLECTCSTWKALKHQNIEDELMPYLVSMPGLQLCHITTECKIHNEQLRTTLNGQGCDSHNLRCMA